MRVSSPRPRRPSMCTDLRLLPSPASPERCRLHHRSAVAGITGAPSPASPERRRLNHRCAAVSCVIALWQTACLRWAFSTRRPRRNQCASRGGNLRVNQRRGSADQQPQRLSSACEADGVAIPCRRMPRRGVQRHHRTVGVKRVLPCIGQLACRASRRESATAEGRFPHCVIEPAACQITTWRVCPHIFQQRIHNCHNDLRGFCSVL